MFHFFKIADKGIKKFRDMLKKGRKAIVYDLLS